ncbi:MAG: peptidoglycan-binding domain-containing protein [Methylococcales bacterium]
MKYVLNLEAEGSGDYSELDEFEEEAINSFSELDEYSNHECESCAEVEPEFDEAEWEAEVMRNRGFPNRAFRTRQGMHRPRFRPRVIRRWPGAIFSDPSICTCPAPRCPQHGSEYVRWVQSALNQIMNLRLPVTGITNAATRSALRSFQQKQGLPVDGIAGPETKEALIGAKGGKSPGADATKPAEPGMTEPPEPATPSPAAEFEFVWETGLNHFEDSFAEFEDGMGEMEWEEEAAKAKSKFRYVKSFASSDADCTAAMNSVKKTRAQALEIINTQIGQAIRMLRVAANKLKPDKSKPGKGNRSPKTTEIFHKIFRVTPDFVPSPSWFKQTATIKDRGDVVATRCRRVADLLEQGGLRYFCTISAKNCPDCPDGKDYSSTYACSSWGKNRVVCLNTPFWKAMGATPIDIPTILAVLMHEPFHVYYGKYVTEHQRRRADGTLVPIGKFGGIYCTTQFVFEINGKSDYPAWMKKVCKDTPVRR